jgi:hypothetical protein
MGALQDLKIVIRPEPDIKVGFYPANNVDGQVIVNVSEQADIRVILSQPHISSILLPDSFILFAETALSSSFAINAITASYVDTSLVSVSTASYASYALFAQNAFPYTGSAHITGSLHITGSQYMTDQLFIGSVNELGSLETPLIIGTDILGPILFVTGSGRLGINTIVPDYALHVVGEIYASGDIIALSDSRYKENVFPLGGTLDRLKYVNGYRYNLISERHELDRKQYIGFIAQELKQQFPELVTGSEHMGYGVTYGNMTAILVEAIKELNIKLLDIENKLNTT